MQNLGMAMQYIFYRLRESKCHPSAKKKKSINDFLAASSVCTLRRQEELEARLVEEETTKRVEELVAKRVQEELERRKDEIEREVLRRVEEAKKVGGAKGSSAAVHVAGWLQGCLYH